MIVLLLALMVQDPSPELTIEGGAHVTRGRSVRARITGVEGKTEGLQMSLTTDEKAAPAWAPFAEATIVELPPGDGEKKVYLRLRDAAGKESPVISAGIRLDTTPPIAKIEAPDRVGTSDVRALFDVPDAVAMQYTEDLQSWSAWEPYATPKTIPLSRGLGKKAVFVRFRDEAGNESQPERLLVEVLAAPPPTLRTGGLRSVLVDVRRQPAEMVRLRVLLDGRDLVELRLTLDGIDLQPRSAWSADLTYDVPALEGPRRLLVQAWDAAGKEERGETVFLDRDAPALTEPERQETNGFSVGLKAGVVPSGIHVKSLMASGSRELKSGAMAAVRLEGAYSFPGPLFVQADFEIDEGKDARVLWGGIDLGFEVDLGRAGDTDWEAIFTVGGYVSTLKVDRSGFGNFDTGYGARGSAGIRARLSEHLWADLGVEFRYSQNAWKEEPVDGDKNAVMQGAAILTGLSWRF